MRAVLLFAVLVGVATQVIHLSVAFSISVLKIRTHFRLHMQCYQ